jgi:hypothetical protein
MASEDGGNARPSSHTKYFHGRTQYGGQLYSSIPLSSPLLPSRRDPHTLGKRVFNPLKEPLLAKKIAIH